MVWIFVIGTVLMRSAGVAVNDVADRNFDPHVARTKNRPLAAGLVSAKEALALAAVLALIAFVMILPLGRLVMLLSFCALFLRFQLSVHQTLFRAPASVSRRCVRLRHSDGVCGAPRTGACRSRGCCCLANVFWTIAYDTEYAMVDRADDRKIGIRTSAILFGRFDVAAVMLCHAAFLLLMAWIGWRVGLGWPYYLGLLLRVALVAYQYNLIRTREPDRCFRAFRHNNWVGAVVFAGIVLGFQQRRALTGVTCANCSLKER